MVGPDAGDDMSPADDVLLSVVICTYNRAQLLQSCLDSLAPQLDAWRDSTEVIVVDNNCTDATPALLREYSRRYAWFRSVREPKQGLSHARNAGADAARGTYVCYLDDDGKPGSDYLLHVHDVMDRHRPDIFGGPIYPYYTSPKPDWFLDEFEIRRHAPQSGFSSCSISGGNFIIRRRLLRQLGMFSPDFGMVGNKVRLGEERAVLELYRRQRPVSEQRVYYSLECFIYHHVPPEKMRLSYFVRRGFFGGKSTVAIKNEPLGRLPGLIPRFLRTGFMELPRLMLARRRDKRFVLALQREALLAGKIVQHLENALRKVLGSRRGRPDARDNAR